MTVGSTTEYTGAETPLPMDIGLPYDRRKSLSISTKFRRTIRAGEMMAASNRFADINATTQPSSTSVVRKRLPDRSLSSDFHSISDLRKVNLGFDVDQFYHVVTPLVVQIVRRIMKLKSPYPSLPVIICKRDVDAAFRKVFMNHALLKLLCREIDVDGIRMPIDLRSRINFFVSRDPFGLDRFPFLLCTHG